MGSEREDYLDAHRRHWEDAELLFQNQRWANAEHLYGLSAECGLKAIWVWVIGYPLPREVRVHIDCLWETFPRLAANRRIPVPLPNENPFPRCWSGRRYASRQNFNHDLAARCRGGAEVVCELVERVQTGGMV